MPRATRYLVEGYLYHLKRRCAAEFLLRFVKERDAYREWLRVVATRRHVSIFGYTGTSNHTHVVCEVRDHLNGLSYVDLNMVRAGKVKHPCEWRCCSYANRPFLTVLSVISRKGIL
jgi:putative transposase